MSTVNLQHGHWLRRIEYQFLMKSIDLTPYHSGPTLVYTFVGGQGGLVVKRPPGNQKVRGSNPTTVTW